MIFWARIEATTLASVPPWDGLDLGDVQRADAVVIVCIGALKDVQA